MVKWRSVLSSVASCQYCCARNLLGHQFPNLVIQWRILSALKERKTTLYTISPVSAGPIRGVLNPHIQGVERFGIICGVEAL